MSADRQFDIPHSEEHEFYARIEKLPESLRSHISLLKQNNQIDDALAMRERYRTVREPRLGLYEQLQYDIGTVLESNDNKERSLSAFRAVGIITRMEPEQYPPQLRRIQLGEVYDAFPREIEHLENHAADITANVEQLFRRQAF